MPEPARPIEPFFLTAAPELFMPGLLPPGTLDPGSLTLIKLLFGVAIRDPFELV